MGTHRDTYKMKTYISTLLFCGHLASANIIIKSEEANEVIQSRQKRALQGAWGRSDMEKECFEDDVCHAFEEFQEGAENIYGKPMIREERRTRQAYKNLYRRCHNGNQFCVNQGNVCECNVQFKNWLENPELPTDTTEAPITEMTTSEPSTTEPISVESTTQDDGGCAGWFCVTDSATEDPI